MLDQWTIGNLNMERTIQPVLNIKTETLNAEVAIFKFFSLSNQY
jgi:hypothetical protein